tara:strand:- start:42 stop:461 length:420 start_codon:yes stop_codon:yes gene_type:complete
MRIETKSVRDGKYLGKNVWICHYHRPDMQKKPLRNIPPTKVLIRSIDDLPKGKKVYYSEVFFSPLNKKGEPLAKVISPVDNTGYRGYCGNELYIFNNEKECNEHWNNQLNNYFVKLDELIFTASDDWRKQKEELLKTRV